MWNITGSKDLTLHEVNEAAEVIYELVDPSALIIFGAVVNPSIKLAEGEVAITLIATGFQPSANPQAGKQQPGMRAPPPPQQQQQGDIGGWGAQDNGGPPPPPRGGSGGRPRGSSGGSPRGGRGGSSRGSGACDVFSVGVCRGFD